jgi:hypothetical protein
MADRLVPEAGGGGVFVVVVGVVVATVVGATGLTGVLPLHATMAAEAAAATMMLGACLVMRNLLLMRLRAC